MRCRPIGTCSKLGYADAGKHCKISVSQGTAMRSISVIALFLIFSPAALALNDSEDTRDLPSPSTGAPAPTPAPPSDAKERNHARRAPAHAQCQAMWVCGRLRYPSNDAYAPGSYVNTIQVGGRSVAGPCHKEKHC